MTWIHISIEITRNWEGGLEFLFDIFAFSCRRSFVKLQLGNDYYWKIRNRGGGKKKNVRAGIEARNWNWIHGIPVSRSGGKFPVNIYILITIQPPHWDARRDVASRGGGWRDQSLIFRRKVLALSKSWWRHPKEEDNIWCSASNNSSPSPFLRPTSKETRLQLFLQPPLPSPRDFHPILPVFPSVRPNQRIYGITASRGGIHLHSVKNTYTRWCIRGKEKEKFARLIDR